MAEQKLPAVSRITDIAHRNSPALVVLGPRVLTSLEVDVIVEELAAVEGFLTTLANYVMEHRSGVVGTGNVNQDKMMLNLLKAAPGSYIDIGDLRINGVVMHSSIEAATLTDANIGVEASVTLEWRLVPTSPVTLFTQTANTYAVHAMLRALPSEAYHALGSYLEELAAALYKGDITVASLNPVHAGTLVRLQDKVLKNLIETSAGAAIGRKEGMLFGPMAVVGKEYARGISTVLIRNLCPLLAEWVFDLDPLGTRAYSTDA